MGPGSDASPSSDASSSIDALVQIDATTADAGVDAFVHDPGPAWVPPATPAAIASAYVKAPNTDAEDWFGTSVALSGDGTTLAIGAMFEKSSGVQSDNSMTAAGAVYIYTWTISGWAFQAYLKPTTPAMGDRFGLAVSLSGDGDLLVVGAPHEDSCAVGVNGFPTVDSCGDSGAAYVFSRSGSTWTQHAYLKPSNTFHSGAFGQAVAIARNGYTIVIGAPGEKSSGKGVGAVQNNSDAFYSGAAYVFARTATSWVQSEYIKASNAQGNNFFGGAVAIAADGSVLVVSAVGEESNATGIGGDQLDNSFTYAGAAYVFRRSSATWVQEAYLKPSNTGDSDQFGVGFSLSVAGDTLAVGANLEDGDVNNPTSNSKQQSGAVYIFTKAAAWSQQAYVKRPVPGGSDTLGLSLELSADGNRLVVGATGDDANGAGIDPVTNGTLDSCGVAEIYSRSGSSWSRTHVIKATNPGMYDIFGHGVAISADGTMMVSSAVNEQSAAVNIDGNQADNTKNQSGAVYVYNLP